MGYGPDPSSALHHHSMWQIQSWLSRASFYLTPSVEWSFFEILRLVRGGAGLMGLGNQINGWRGALVRKGGIEPPWSNDHRLLRPARLPIPPLSRLERDEILGCRR